MENNIKTFAAEIDTLIDAMKAEIIKHLVTPETNGVFGNTDHWHYHTIVEGPCESEDEAACAYYVYNGNVYARYKPVTINDWECDWHHADCDYECYEYSDTDIKPQRIKLEYDKDDILIDENFFHLEFALINIDGIKEYI
ncbi:MAG: hypothetical protein J6U53_01325 [Tidjanibacter sp.]|nr:hypothetical protein [Tidjanibacter sp.]